MENEPASLRNVAKMKPPAPGCIIAMIPEDDEKLGQELEDWAILYSHRLSRLYSKRYHTAYAFRVGSIYASKLPEHELVTLLLKCAALAYVLRAGVKYPSSEFHTIHARINTLLYRRLRIRESTLYAALQRLVWVAAGRLKREQLWPAAYILWQQM